MDIIITTIMITGSMRNVSGDVRFNSNRCICVHVYRYVMYIYGALDIFKILESIYYHNLATAEIFKLINNSYERFTLWSLRTPRKLKIQNLILKRKLHYSKQLRLALLIQFVSNFIL